MMVIFKKEKENFEKIERIMTHKDFDERNVFKVKFPNTKLLLCNFHIRHSFRREITVKKMKLTAEERTHCLNLS